MQVARSIHRHAGNVNIPLLLCCTNKSLAVLIFLTPSHDPIRAQQSGNLAVISFDIRTFREAFHRTCILGALIRPWSQNSCPSSNAD